MSKEGCKGKEQKTLTSGKRCENKKGRFLVLYLGTTTSLKMENFSLFVVTEYKK
jgi:hypothetical protein